MELAWIYATMNEIRIWSLRSLAGAGKHTWTLNYEEFFFSFLSSVTNWQNKYINVLSHYLTSVALCFSDSKKGQWRPDSPSAVYQWKSNIVHKQASGNQYFITKLLVRMKKNSGSFFGSLLGPGCCEFNVGIAVTCRGRLGAGSLGWRAGTKAFVLQEEQ